MVIYFKKTTDDSGKTGGSLRVFCLFVLFYENLICLPSKEYRWKSIS